MSLWTTAAWTGQLPVNNAGSPAPGASGTATASPVPVAIATGITYQRCISETSGPYGRALNASLSDVGTMSIDLCAQTAQSRNYRYFGLEYKTQCLLGNTINPASTALAATSCNLPCGGNPAQSCGGADAISLYTNDLYTAPSTVQLAQVPNQAAQYVHTGCYSEPPTGRALGPYQAPDNSAMTVEACAALCYSKGSQGPFTYMGVENGIQCFCSYTAPSNGAALSPGGNADCSTVCGGDPKQYCGAPAKLNVYQLRSGGNRVAKRLRKRKV